MPWLTSTLSVIPRPVTAPRWDLGAVTGRICELSAEHAAVALTLAMGLVLDAQRHGETCAWLTTHDSMFYAPDAATLGIDLSALLLIRAPDTRALGRAADHLARSGGFGLLVLDLASIDPARSALHAPHMTLAMPLQSRLLGLAQKHRMGLLVLSRKSEDEPSLSSLVSLRGQVQRRVLDQGRLSYELHAIKDKQRAPGWVHREVVDGPPGLC